MPYIYCNIEYYPHEVVFNTFLPFHVHVRCTCMSTYERGGIVVCICFIENIYIIYRVIYRLVNAHYHFPINNRIYSNFGNFNFINY